MTDETDVLYREYREWVAKRDVVRSELVRVDLSNEQVLADAFARLEEVNAAEVVLNDLARRIAANEDQKQVVFNHWVRLLRERKAKLQKDSPSGETTMGSFGA
ncbi:MAG TPA: hypothetical protein VEX68_03225 [Bryobacteraceae bacterium]|nr:hypothetical protein [Bryobacteraceae bacterium]